MINATNALVIVHLAFVRLAVLNMYQRLFGVYQLSRYLISVGYVGIALLTLSDLGVTIGRATVCINPGVANIYVSFCRFRSANIAVVTFSVAGVVLDVYIYSIALYRLRTLQVKRGKKLQLMALFGSGMM